LDTPSKWDDSANDGRGGSRPADKDDLQASYSVKLTVDKDVFNESEFKKQIDDVWSLAQTENDGKFDVVKAPYWCDDDGNCVMTARRNAAYQKGGKIQGMRPSLEDYDGRDITKWVQEENISVASGSLGRLDVTTFVPTPKKKKQTDGSMVATLRMNLDLCKVQFKELKRYEGNTPMATIEGGVPVSDGMEDIPF
jgi:hypothetical protein